MICTLRETITIFCFNQKKSNSLNKIQKYFVCSSDVRDNFDRIPWPSPFRCQFIDKLWAQKSLRNETIDTTAKNVVGKLYSMARI